MSQYPSPYYPPNPQPPYLPYAVGSADILGPAKRASIIMFILGGLLLMLGLCETLNALVAPMDEVLKRARDMQGSQAAQIPMTAAQLKIFVMVISGLFSAMGIAFIGLAVGVRRGGRTTTVLAMILTVLIVAGLGLTILVMLVASLQAPAALGFVCLLLIPGGLMVPLVIWLIGAMRALPHLAGAHQQYLAQYWQYQQNMQAHAGYGYAGQTQAPPPHSAGDGPSDAVQKP